MSYLDRLRNRQPLPVRTDETDESPPSHTEKALGGTDKTDKSPLSSVLAPPPGAFSKYVDPWPDLYRAWFDGIEEPRALVTLTPGQALDAEALGCVPAELRRACVLLAYRSPLGAYGLLAVPREKWDAFDALKILEGAPCLH